MTGYQAVGEALLALRGGVADPARRWRALLTCADGGRADGVHRLAIGYYTRAIEADPGCAVAYFGRGLSRLAWGEPEAAYADHQKVIALSAEPGAVAPAVRAAALRERGRARGEAGESDLRAAI